MRFDFLDRFCVVDPPQHPQSNHIARAMSSNQPGPCRQGDREYRSLRMGRPPATQAQHPFATPDTTPRTTALWCCTPSCPSPPPSRRVGVALRAAPVGQRYIRREGGGGSGTQTFVHQKWPKSRFPFVNSMFSHYELRVQGVTPLHPSVVSRSNTSLGCAPPPPPPGQAPRSEVPAHAPLPPAPLPPFDSVHLMSRGQKSGPSKSSRDERREPREAARPPASGGRQPTAVGGGRATDGGCPATAVPGPGRP